MKKKILIIILLIIGYIADAQIDTQTKSLVKWLTIEQADSLYHKAPKPLLIDIYTDWCGWCKHMLKTTYSAPSIAGFINNNFYPVQINAETQDTLTYEDVKYPPQGKHNSLAIKLLNRQMSYPTTIFISSDKKHTVPIPGYLKTNQIEPFLIYFAENLHNYTSLNEFNAAYMFAYPQNYKEEIKNITADAIPDTTGEINSFTFKNAFEDKNKKYILFTYVDWCYSCKIMNKVTFKNSIVADEINKNYKFIEFNAATPETITINNKEYKSLGKGQPNELAIELMKSNFIFPAMIFLDNNFQIITVVNGYYSAIQLEPILQYISSDSYKNIKFDDFYKTFKSKINPK